jgi:beta-barrel assembly-enhancing protease
LLDAGANWLKEKVSKNKITQKALNTGAEISARNLDKSAEYEADSMGLVLAARAGYEPYGLAEVLQSMAQMNSNDNSVSLLFKTHPHPDERLTQLGLLSGNQLDAMTNGKTLEQRFYIIR